jgi:hypothetical protein
MTRRRKDHGVAHSHSNLESSRALARCMIGSTHTGRAGLQRIAALHYHNLQETAPKQQGSSGDGMPDHVASLDGADSRTAISLPYRASGKLRDIKAQYPMGDGLATLLDSPIGILILPDEARLRWFPSSPSYTCLLRVEDSSSTTHGPASPAISNSRLCLASKSRGSWALVDKIRDLPRHKPNPA